MKTSFSFVLAAGAAVLWLGGGGAAAQTILNETWESYANGAPPLSPWTVNGGGGTSTPSTVDVESQTFNGITSKWAAMNNTAIDETNNNPGIFATFTPTTSLLDISFTYTITQTSGTSTQLEFLLSDGSGHNAVTIVLGKNYQGIGMGFITPGTTFNSMGDTFVLGETVTVDLTNVNLSAGTFGYSWTSSNAGHASGSGSGAFTASVTSLSKISFTDNAPTSGTSEMYVDNISVAAVPEPRAAALAGAVCLAFALAGMARRLRGA